MLISLAGFAYDLYHFANSPLLSNNESIDYVLKPGLGIQAFSNDLIHLGIIKPHQRYYLRLLIKLRGDTMALKSGEYRLQPNATPDDIIDQMVQGRVLYHDFTIVDGWTFRDLKQALALNPFIKHTIKQYSNKAILKKLQIKHPALEGLFYPDTYKFTRQMTDLELLAWAHQNMQKQLAEAWKNRAKGLPYQSAYQALIAASLIEKETAIPAEGSKIAGVLVRRLKKRMRLQFDPTVIYALGTHYDGRLTKQDLRIDSPYNTYRVYGLPPTPIALPSLDALQAALHPDDSHHLYFVATGTGGHVFSDTLEAHNLAVKKYILNRKSKREKTTHKILNKSTLEQYPLGCIDGFCYQIGDLVFKHNNHCHQLNVSGGCL